MEEGAHPSAQNRGKVTNDRVHAKNPAKAAPKKPRPPLRKRKGNSGDQTKTYIGGRRPEETSTGVRPWPKKNSTSRKATKRGTYRKRKQTEGGEEQRNVERANVSPQLNGKSTPNHKHKNKHSWGTGLAKAPQGSGSKGPGP